MASEQNKRVSLLGIQLDLLTMEETLARVEQIILARHPEQHVVVNASKVNLIAKNKALQEIVNSCSLINVDGQSIVWAGRFLGFPVQERVTGIDLFSNLVKIAAKKGYRVYYFGAEEEVVEKVIQIHQETFPALKIAGYRNGYFEEEDSLSIAEEIRDSHADILFVAFSSPKKEFWIHRYKEIMNVPFSMGVGGSFDIIAGKTKRAPSWMQKIGLEWFYRFLQEPRRMFRRYLLGNLTFLKLVWKEKRRGK